MFKLLTIIAGVYLVSLDELCQVVCQETPDNPAVENFVRRAYQSSVVVNNVLYIDGGELSQLSNGTSDINTGFDFSPFPRPCNSTLYIDLSTSWTNSSVIINAINKTDTSIPRLNSGVLWRAPNEMALYQWGGQLSSVAIDEATPLFGFWKFAITLGGGFWSQVPQSSSVFKDLVRQSYGWGLTVRDTAYYYGGQVDDLTDPSAELTQFVPGVTSLNFTSGIWSVNSTAGLNSQGTITGSMVVAIKALGLDQRDILVTLGGLDPSCSDCSNTQEISFSNVSLYDPSIDVWFAQKATGQFPEPRNFSCAVAVQGDNGTYEIFVYAGTNYETTFDDIHILTIPGFNWFQAPYDGNYPRTTHTCEVIGNRQMVAIGGLPHLSNASPVSPWTIPDSFLQGLGIFDMTELSWKSSYNADAPAYITPNIVKQWYDSGGLQSVEWQSKEISRYFVGDSTDSLVTISPTPVASSIGSASTSLGSSGGLSKSDIIAIGIGIPSFIATFVGAPGVLLYKWRRAEKKKRKKLQEENDSSESCGDLETTSTPLPNSGTPLRNTRNESPFNSIPGSERRRNSC